VAGLGATWGVFKGKIAKHDEEIREIKEEQDCIRSDISTLVTDMAVVKTDVKWLRKQKENAK